MYSTKVINTKLNTIQAQLNDLPPAERFTLKPRSVEECRSYVEHFKSIQNPDPKGKPFIRDLYQDELEFIKSERIICKHYWRYWAERYATIKSRLGHSNLKDIATDEALMLWRANNAQKIVMRILSELDERQLPIMLLFLKARQLGVSTMVELLIYHRINFYSNINAYVASADPDKSDKMANMMVLIKDHHPFWLSPTINHTKSTELFFSVPELNNTVTKEHGSPKKTGIATGDSPDIVHLSETSRYQNPYYDIDSALIKAFHPNPMSLFIMESTADGDTGWWYETWKFAEENWSKGLSDFCPIFLGWFLGIDLYPTNAWLRQKEYAFVNWQPKPDTIAHALKVQQYVRNNTLLSDIMGSTYILPKEQQFFYEVDKESYAAKGNLYNFLSEMPATPKEAFQSPTGNVFPVEVIDRLRNYSRPLATYQGKPAVFAIMGDGLEVEYQPLIEEIDSSREAVSLKVDLNNGENICNYRLVPLIHNDTLWENRLFIYEFPFPNSNKEQLYCVGIDTAEGKGQDRTGASVVKKGTAFTPSEQVAEYFCDNMMGDEFLPIAMAICHLYSYYGDTFDNQALCSVEVNKGDGAVMQNEMRKLGYSNFYRSLGYINTVQRKQGREFGWYTTEKTRPYLVGDVRRDIRNGFLLINSPFTIEECQTLVYNGRIEAKSNCKDDRFFATAIAHFTQSSEEIKHRAEEVNPDYSFEPVGQGRLAMQFKHPMLAEAQAREQQAQEQQLQYRDEAARLGLKEGEKIYSLGSSKGQASIVLRDMNITIEGV